MTSAAIVAAETGGQLVASYDSEGRPREASGEQARSVPSEPVITR